MLPLLCCGSNENMIHKNSEQSRDSRERILNSNGSVLASTISSISHRWCWKLDENVRFRGILGRAFFRVPFCHGCRRPSHGVLFLFPFPLTLILLPTARLLHRSTCAGWTFREHVEPHGQLCSLHIYASM